MKGVIYARYSSDNQREESIEGQLRECKEYAERNDITILGTYIDRALSAKTDNRPEFQHMIKESAKGLFDVVLVWKLDRFARNRYDSARYKNLLKKNGVKVISARENISEGSEGIILEAMLEGYAEYYSAELSEKVIRGLTDNALKCKYNGGTVPMGYYIDEQQYYQIDPKTAPVVLEMFTKYSEGATMQELVNLLNSRGMRSIRGGKITLNIMNHLLKNRRYMGEYSYRDVVKENGIPAIVPKELFERVQERLAKNKKAPARHKAEDDYLLTTKLYCGKCGSFMVGESGTSHTMKVHRYYRCVNTKKKKLCDKKAVKKDWIEDLVVNYTMKAIMNDEVMERLIDTLMELQKKESTDLPLLKKQLAETEKGINNMLNAIQAGIFTPSTKQRLDELEETKSQLEVSILQEEMHKPLLTREQIAFFIYRFRKFDVTKREQRQRLIDSFVNAVYLYEDKIILTFNYKDGSKTITLAEVEGSDLSVLGAPSENLVTIMVARFFVFPKSTRRLCARGRLRRRSCRSPATLDRRRDRQRQQRGPYRDRRHIQEGQRGGKVLLQRLIGSEVRRIAGGGIGQRRRHSHDPVDDLFPQRRQPQNGHDPGIGTGQQIPPAAPPHRRGPQQAADRRKQQQQHIPPEHDRQIRHHAAAVCIVRQQCRGQSEGHLEANQQKVQHQHGPRQQHDQTPTENIAVTPAPADPHRRRAACQQQPRPCVRIEHGGRQQEQGGGGEADAPAQLAPAGQILRHLTVAAATSHRRTGQNVVGGDAVQLCQRGQNGNVREPAAALPFADGLVGDAQPVGCVLLGHARVLSEGRQIGAGFCGIHIMVTLLSVWSQYAADGAGRPSRR